MSAVTFGGAPNSDVDNSFGRCLFGTVQEQQRSKKKIRFHVCFRCSINEP